MVTSNKDTKRAGSENITSEHLFDNATGLWNLADYGATPNFNAGVKGKVFISKNDKEILRRLATKVAALALLL